MKLNNNKGSLLIISLFVLIILLLLGAAFIVTGINEGRIAERQRRTTVAFNIAEAGIERALYDLRQDFVQDLTSPSWADSDINGFAIGPNTSTYYQIPYAGETPDNTMNGGSYNVEILNLTGDNEAIWIRSTGSLGDAVQTIRVYAKIKRLSPWNNAIFAGAGAAGAMVNGNVDIRGSVHILGDSLGPTDLAVDLGGTAELVGNNYNGLDSSLATKVPALQTTVFNGETVETLNAELRVKHGQVGLSGSATVGEADASSNSVKETVDGSFVTDGYTGSQGTGNVHSDNGWSNAYDLGDSVSFPSLSDPFPGYTDYQAYLKDNAYVINNAADLAELASITPNSSFTFSGTDGSISMDGNGNMTIDGIIYIEGGSLNMSKAGSDDTITYNGSGSILVTGNAQIDVSLVTNGAASFPNNILGLMTPGTIGFNEAQIDVMGLMYAETSVVVQKQTDIMGTIVANYFDMGTNVPAIYQVPETINNLPDGIIGQEAAYAMKIISWQKQ